MPNYYTLLLRKIRDCEDDPAKLRELVYEAARLALKRHVNVCYPAVSLQDGKRLMTDLEAAITRLETDAGSAVRRLSATSAADKAASLFVQPERNFQEFDFRAAFEGRPHDFPANRKASETPSEPPQPLSDQAAFTVRDDNETPIILTQSADDQSTFTIRRDNDARSRPTLRAPNRFAPDRRDENRKSFAPNRRGNHDRAAFDHREEDQVPHPTGAPHDWPDGALDGKPATRELLLVPDHSVQANRGAATYLVRRDGFARRSDDYSRDPPPTTSPGRTILIGIAIISQVAIVVLAGTAFYVAMWERPADSPPFRDIAASTPHLPPKVPPVLPVAQPAVEAPDSAALAPAAAAAIAPTAPAAATQAFPRPTAYGIYAISDNRLIELEQVATAPVDPRTRSTLAIAKPSRTVITDPKLTFVAYRRDLISSAPDKVPVRIAARIAKQMTFDGAGKAVTAPPPTETWLVRDQGYDLRVSPVRDSPEMVVLRPDGDDFSFPAGRYELVLGGQNYDFAIAGPVTDPAQCVEGVATGRGPVFYECRTQ